MLYNRAHFQPTVIFMEMIYQVKVDENVLQKRFVIKIGLRWGASAVFTTSILPLLITVHKLSATDKIAGNKYKKLLNCKIPNQPKPVQISDSVIS